MASLKIDLVDGNAGRYTISGWEGVSRMAMVTGVTGTDTAKLQTAIQAAGVPDIGDEHPSLANLFVSALVPASIEPTIVTLRIEYSPDVQTIDEPVASTTSVGTSLSSAQRNTDVNGADLEVSFSPSNVAPFDDLKTQTGMVDAFLPETTITAVRRESASPGTKAKDYVGKVNDSGWSLDPAANAEEWLCTGITGTSSDNGITWDVTYTFTFREAQGTLLTKPGWDVVVVYIDPETGRPPEGVSDQLAAAQRFQIYETIDFDGLDL